MEPIERVVGAFRDAGLEPKRLSESQIAGSYFLLSPRERKGMAGTLEATKRSDAAQSPNQIVAYEASCPVSARHRVTIRRTATGRVFLFDSHCLAPIDSDRMLEKLHIQLTDLFSDSDPNKSAADLIRRHGGEWRVWYAIAKAYELSEREKEIMLLFLLNILPTMTYDQASRTDSEYPTSSEIQEAIATRHGLNEDIRVIGRLNEAAQVEAYNNEFWLTFGENDWVSLLSVAFKKLEELRLLIRMKEGGGYRLGSLPDAWTRPYSNKRLVRVGPLRFLW